MSARNSDDIQANSGGNPDTPETTARNEKPSDPEAPYVFKHAPPKPAKDPWEIILQPELEADTERCNAWKEEVQNLLIFAGLFSAVVTAFVIESYKFLQPDPNAAVVGLLFHIANSSLNSSTPFPPSVDLSSIMTPFSQTSSAIRINIFWFLSLILSLTTVLVGTISLQWLREHQSYPNFSPQEKVAILHMRLQALDAWYVPQIFSGLPLLLQGALALFLAGMIDFSLPLGARLAVPVAIIIGVTLLFLCSTTVIPAFQCLSFICDIIYPRKSVPTPCAFKSPQSQIFRVFVALLVTGFFHLFPKFTIKKAEHSWEMDVNPLPKSLQHLVPSIYSLWDSKNWQSWPTFDREWISLRDACQHHISDKDPYLYEHREEWTQEFPLSDVTQVLLKAIKETPSAKHTKEFLEAAIYCFEQLSKSVWTKQKTQWFVKEQRKDRRNNYFEQLLSLSDCSLSKWLIHGGVFKFGQVDSTTLCDYIGDTKTVLFHQDQMVYFLGLLLDTHSSSNLAQYQIELWTQLIMKSHIPPQTPAHNFSSSTPTILEWNSWGFPIQFIKNHYQKYSSVVGMLSAVFHSAALHHISKDQSLQAPYTHPKMGVILPRMALWTNSYLRWATQIGTADPLGQQQLQEIDAQYTSIFKFVAEHLKEEMSNSTSHPQEDIPSVLFYLASIFMWNLLDQLKCENFFQTGNNKVSPGLSSLQLHEALLQYRAWSSGRKNDVLEEQFKNNDHSFGKFKDLDRFSDEWWDDLFESGRKIGLYAANPGPALIEGNGLDSRPGPSSQKTHPPRNTADIVAIPSFSSAPAGADPEALDLSTPDINSIDPTSTARVEPHAMSLVNLGPIHDDHDVGERQQMLSDGDPPAIDNGNTTMIARPDPNDSPPRSASHASIGEPNESRELGGNYATTESTTPESPPMPPAPSPDVVGLALPHNIFNRFSDTDDAEAHLQTDNPHMAIDVGSPVEAERSEVMQVAELGDGPPQAGEPHTAIEVGEPDGVEEIDRGEDAGSGEGPLQDKQGVEDVTAGKGSGK